MRRPYNRMRKALFSLLSALKDKLIPDNIDNFEFAEKLICASIRSLAAYLLHPDEKLYISNDDNSYVIIKHGYTEYQIAPCADVYLDDEYFLELFRKMLIIYGINKSYTSLDLQHMIGKVVYVFYSMEYFENQDRLFLKSNKNIDDIKVTLFRKSDRLRYIDIPRDYTDFKKIIYLMYYFYKLCSNENIYFESGLSTTSKLSVSYLIRSFTESIEYYLKDHLPEHKEDIQYMYIPSVLPFTYFKICIVKKTQWRGKLHSHNIKIEVIKDTTNDYKIDDEYLEYFENTCKDKFNFTLNDNCYERMATVIMTTIYNTLRDLDLGLRQKFITTNVPILRAQLYLEPRFNPIIYIY